ncbi:MAG: class I SAM-dependent DNA methyltransferase [Acidiferrobacterales bacterium]
MADRKRSKSLLERAYDLQSGDEALSLYRDWATSYDTDLVDPLGYVGPARVADIAAARCRDFNAQILDVGCGTGLVGERLASLGYRKMDGLDFSQEMLDVARTKNVYGVLINADLTQPLSIETASYDFIVSCGTFTHGHVGPEALDELLRITRAGGIFCISINTEIYRSNGFADKLSELENTGRVLVESRVTIPLMTKEPVNGVIVTLEKKA